MVGVLKADSTLHGLVGDRVYTMNAPTGALYPFLVLKNMAPVPPTRGVGAVVIWENEYWMVKAVVKELSRKNAGAIMDRVKVVLDRGSGITTSGKVVACVSEGSVEYSEVVNGSEFVHLGIRFRLNIQ